MNPNIAITEAACEYIKKMIHQKKGIGFRLSIKKTGCSGYSYLPSIIEKANASDITFDTANGVKVYLDTVWLELMQGLKIDYIEEEKSGLKQKRLVFVNPNEAGRCGCGESFTIE